MNDVKRGSAKLLVIAGVLALALSAGSSGPAQETPDRGAPPMPLYEPKFFPFAQGEHASYQASWNGIPVATAEVLTTPVAIAGKKFYRVRVDAKTSRGLDLIWRMRDTITSLFEAQTLAPSRYFFSQRENSRSIDTQAHFNPQTHKWEINRWQEGREPRRYELDSNRTLDPLSAVYLARSLDFKVGDKLIFDVFGGRHRYLVELAVEKKEPVELQSGAVVEAFRIVPKITNLTKQGYSGRMREAIIWISADQRRMPIKLWSRIFVGTVQMDLVRDSAGVHSTDTAGAAAPAG